MIKYTIKNISRIVLISILASGCSFSYGLTQGKIVKSGLIDVYPEDALDSRGSPLPASPSAVSFDGKFLTFASDKRPGDDYLSAAYSIETSSWQDDFSKAPLNFLTQPRFKNINKYESSATTPNGKYVLLAGCFGTLDSKKFDKQSQVENNMLVAYPRGEPENVQLVAETTIDECTFSYSLRNSMLRALKTPKFPNGIPYFNIEAMTIIPGNKIIFGIREFGPDWGHPDNVMSILLIAASYQIIDGKFMIFNDFNIIYQVDPKKLLDTPTPIGIAELEYDKYNKRLIMSTSMESGNSGTLDNIATYLWTLTLDDLLNQQLPRPVLGEDGKPLKLAHKFEGITLMDANHLFLAADDDNILLDANGNPFRKPNQASYAIIELTELDDQQGESESEQK